MSSANTSATSSLSSAIFPTASASLRHYVEAVGPFSAIGSLTAIPDEANPRLLRFVPQHNVDIIARRPRNLYAHKSCLALKGDEKWALTDQIPILERVQEESKSRTIRRNRLAIERESRNDDDDAVIRVWTLRREYGALAKDERLHECRLKVNPDAGVDVLSERSFAVVENGAEDDEVVELRRHSAPLKIWARGSRGTLRLFDTEKEREELHRHEIFVSAQQEAVADFCEMNYSNGEELVLCDSTGMTWTGRVEGGATTSFSRIKGAPERATSCRATDHPRQVLVANDEEVRLSDLRTPEANAKRVFLAPKREDPPSSMRTRAEALSAEADERTRIRHVETGFCASAPHTTLVLTDRRLYLLDARFEQGPVLDAPHAVPLQNGDAPIRVTSVQNDEGADNPDPRNFVSILALDPALGELYAWTLRSPRADRGFDVWSTSESTARRLERTRRITGYDVVPGWMAYQEMGTGDIYVKRLESAARKDDGGAAKSSDDERRMKGRRLEAIKGRRTTRVKVTGKKEKDDEEEEEPAYVRMPTVLAPDRFARSKAPPLESIEDERRGLMSQTVVQAVREAGGEWPNREEEGEEEEE